jgi:murein DD-endopeptidase MepM/ murein hydrolase activator NlpD
MSYDMNVATTAYNTAVNLGASDKVLLALFEAGIVESGMRNLNYGDRDSVGFLQQRPSQGWGTIEQCTDVAYATTSFVKEAQKIESKYDNAGDLAAAVQKPAKIYEYRYNANKKNAENLLDKVSGGISKTITLPVKGATEDNISSYYGEQRSDHIHKGIDIAMPLGSICFTIFGGTVLNLGYSTSYGNFVEVLNGNGYKEFFAHLSSISVNKGDNLLAGGEIGKVGSTGNSTGNHLHYEIRDLTGNKIDPLEYLKENASTGISNDEGILSSLTDTINDFIQKFIGLNITIGVYTVIFVIAGISVIFIFKQQNKIVSTSKKLGKDAVDIGVSLIPGGGAVTKVAKKGMKVVKGGK